MSYHSIKEKRLTQRPKNGLRSFVKYDGFHHTEVRWMLGILRHL